MSKVPSHTKGKTRVHSHRPPLLAKGREKELLRLDLANTGRKEEKKVPPSAFWKRTRFPRPRRREGEHPPRKSPVVERKREETGTYTRNKQGFPAWLRKKFTISRGGKGPTPKVAITKKGKGGHATWVRVGHCEGIGSSNSNYRFASGRVKKKKRKY